MIVRAIQLSGRIEPTHEPDPPVNVLAQKSHGLWLRESVLPPPQIHYYNAHTTGEVAWPVSQRFLST